MEPRRSIRRLIVICQGASLAFGLSTVLGSCAAGQPRSSDWVIANSQCHIWAQSMVNQQYGPQLQEARRQQQQGIAAGNYLGSAQTGMAGLTEAMTEIARQGDETNLYRACMQKSGFAPE